jgi:DNA polymerase-3 subunit gamma/tau
VAYQTLYRKYRPQRFADVVGQSHVTTAVRNAVRDGRVGHAYLFSGPRGTGKTTMARLLAKALNCTNRQPDGDACGVCENCVGIADGRFLDLFELDAASNNGVEAMRDLTESAYLGLGPNSSYKVYLIDEVHMLSTSASNALLKTLEEPPDHVVFVLATTGPEKVLPTIRSRTQHYEFTLHTLDEIVAHLADVCAKEGVAAEPEALEVIARAAAGSMRDALSLLDQTIAHGAVDAEQVSVLFGGTAFERRVGVLEAIADEDTAGALVAVGEMLDAGFDPRRIAEDLLVTARDAFLVTTAKGRVRVDEPEDHVARLNALGERAGPALLVRTLEALGQGVVDMRGTDAADPRLVLEIAVVRLARRDAGPPVQALAERVDRLEKTIAAGNGGNPSSEASPPSPPNPRRGKAKEQDTDPPPRATPAKTFSAVRRERQAQASTPADGPAEDAADAEPEPEAEQHRELPPADAPRIAIDDVILAWADLLPALPPATRAAAQEAQPISIDDDVITFGVPKSQYANARPRFHKERETIRDALAERLGRRMQFQLKEHDGFDAAPTGRASSSARSGPNDSSAGTDDEEDVLDITELIDADVPGAAVDSVTLAAQRLDATIVEELPRD